MKHLPLSWLMSALAPAEESDSRDARAEAEVEVEAEAEADEDLVWLNEVIGATVVYPQDQGQLQFNLKPGYRDRRTDQLGVVNWEIEIGATDWWQFELNWDAPMIRGGQNVDTVIGIGDFELGTQFTWMNMVGSLVSGAFAFEVGFPTARPEDEELDAPAEPTVAAVPRPRFGDGRFLYRPFVTLAVDILGRRGQLFTNLGAELSADKQLPLITVGAFAASSIVRPSLVFGWTLEKMQITPGMTFVAGEAWEFAIGFPVGLNPQTDRFGVTALIIYEFNPLERVGH